MHALGGLSSSERFPFPVPDLLLRLVHGVRFRRCLSPFRPLWWGVRRAVSSGAWKSESKKVSDVRRVGDMVVRARSTPENEAICTLKFWSETATV